MTHTLIPQPVLVLQEDERLHRRARRLRDEDVVADLRRPRHVERNEPLDCRRAGERTHKFERAPPRLPNLARPPDRAAQRRPAARIRLESPFRFARSSRRTQDERKRGQNGQRRERDSIQRKRQQRGGPPGNEFDSRRSLHARLADVRIIIDAIRTGYNGAELQSSFPILCDTGRSHCSRPR